jgi:PAS domain S-box-containing protein
VLSERKGETIKILIVEDEIIVAEDIKDVLEEKGYIVVAIASSGEEAITQAAEKKPHLVLMDIRLRGKIDGVQAAEQIWNTHKIPILYLTANSDPNTIERWLHTILNSLGDAVIATDNQNCVTLLNPVAEALTGWKQSDAFGKNSTDIFQIIHEETRSKVESPITKALQSGNSVILPEQTLLIARDGAETPIDDSATPIKGDRGEIMGGVVVFRDIGERKRLQKRLETHHGITRILAEANTLTEAIPQLLQRLCKGLDWDLGEFWVVDPQANVLRYADSWHLPSVNVSAFVEVARQFSFSPGAGLPGRTWESGQPIWITTIDRDARFLRSFAAARSRLRSAFRRGITYC